MDMRDEGKGGVSRMTVRFLTCTLGWMAKPCPETGTLDKDQLAGGRL